MMKISYLFKIQLKSELKVNDEVKAVMDEQKERQTEIFNKI